MICGVIGHLEGSLGAVHLLDQHNILFLAMSIATRFASAVECKCSVMRVMLLREMRVSKDGVTGVTDHQAPCVSGLDEGHSLHGDSVPTSLEFNAFKPER
jgi:hypothetical protein